MKRDPALSALAVKDQGGRPRNTEPSSSVSTWLPAGEYDELIRRANREDLTISAFVRRELRLRPR